ncbi:helix-turn-helix domain-containing protein [Blautia sp. MCC283]|uniref:helix-turn-helix domain-containing protein n=1 Tax=Blautia sp. MCC283 TaxID=2592640 RepID=UPI001C01C975|nr:helix-turn-helix domain-containing protein [Blautia sp. MCC283]MBT9840059.1 helix-turn-helix domain-containing protein [Blautia sp. MCC283]
MKGSKLYDMDDLQELLGIGRTRAYELVKEAYKTQSPFKVIKLGKLYRIPKKPFDDWMEGNT